MDHVILEIGLVLLLIGIAEALERDLHQHIHLENNILFPKADAKQLTMKKASITAEN